MFKTKFDEIFSKSVEELKHDAFSIYDDENDILIYKDQADYEIYVEYNTNVKHYHVDFETLQTTTNGNYEYIIDDFGDICIVASIECFEATTNKLLDLIKYIQDISQEFNKK